MKNLKNNDQPGNKITDVKKTVNLNIIAILSLLSATMLLSSCEAIGDIFKAGMGVGIFIVLAVVLLIVVLVMRAGKK